MLFDLYQFLGISSCIQSPPTRKRVARALLGICQKPTLRCACRSGTIFEHLSQANPRSNYRDSLPACHSTECVVIPELQQLQDLRCDMLIAIFGSH